MSEKTNELEYLIPRRINQGYEFAPGWGLRQVAAVLIGLAGGVLIWFVMHFWLTHLFRVPLFVQVLPPILGGGLGVVVARTQPDGSTVLDLLTAARSWSKKQKRYLYDWSRDDW